MVVVRGVLRYCYAHRSQLLVASTMLGSALVMKLVPASGLLPAPLDTFEQEQRHAFQLFAKTPLVAIVLDLIGLGWEGFMMGLAFIELFLAQQLLISSTALVLRIAGAWLVVEMIGAEYCLRMSGFHHEFAVGYEAMETWGMTMLHLFLAYHGYRLALHGLTVRGHKLPGFDGYEQLQPLSFGSDILAAILPAANKIVTLLSEQLASCCGRRSAAPAAESGSGAGSGSAAARGRAALSSRTTKKRDATPEVRPTEAKGGLDDSKKAD